MSDPGSRPDRPAPAEAQEGWPAAEPRPATTALPAVPPAPEAVVPAAPGVPAPGTAVVPSAPAQVVVPPNAALPDPALPAGSWDLDLAAATLSMETGDTDSLFEALGGKLERILGTRVQIQREGGFRRKHRIGKIVIDTGEGRLEATRSRTGPVFLRVHAVRGITLQTAEITADDWLARLIAMVGREASRSADVRSALGRLLDT